MNKSRAYRSTLVKNICVNRLLKARDGQSVYVGFDVGKGDVHVMVRWGSEDFERPWKVDNPLEIGCLVDLLQQLKQGRSMITAMEPTGTYGDALRHSLGAAGILVHRVSPQASSNYGEIFDSVPSKHDGKDAGVVAELAAIGKSSPWPMVIDDWEQELAVRVDWLETQRRWLSICYGNLESLVARHWPEATRSLRLTSGVLLRCLAEYGGPAALAAAEGGVDQLQRWSRGHLTRERIVQLVEQAGRSAGVRQTAADCFRMQRYAQEAIEGRRQKAQAKKELRLLAAEHPVLQAQSKAVSAVTACVLWVSLGDPREYDCGAAYRKAMGLNLKIRSSGKWTGRLMNSKRGAGTVRRWLYFSAMRLVKQPGVAEWYQSQKAKKSGDDGSPSKRALNGVMRKLALALYHVAVTGEEFDSQRLFVGASKQPVDVV